MKKHNRFKILCGFAFAFILALFSLYSFGYTAKADDSSIPAIYNGSDAYSQNNQALKSDGNDLNYGARFNMDGANSMYTGDQAGPGYYRTAIFNLNDYKDNGDSSNLSEEVQISNSSATAAKQVNNIEVDLPTPLFMGVIKNHPTIQYANKQATAPSADSSKGLTVTYYAGNDEVNTASAADQWTKVTKILISGTLEANGHYDLNLPLKLTNASQVNVDTITNCFETHIKSGTNDYGLYGRFSRGILLSSYAGVGKPYGIVLKVPEGKNASGNDTYSYPQASDVQPQMPDVVLNSDTAEVNNAFFNDGLTYLYNGSNYTMHFANMKSKNNPNMNLIDYLNQNGYGMPFNENSLMTTFTYRIGTTATTVPPTYPTGTPVYNTGLGMQVVKIIDVKGLNYNDTINLPVGGKWNAYNEVSIWNPDTTYQANKLTDSQKSQIGLQIASSDGKLAPNNDLDTSKTGTYHVTYSFVHSYPNGEKRTISKTITVIVGNPSTGSGTGSGAISSSSSSPVTSSKFQRYRK